MMRFDNCYRSHDGAVLLNFFCFKQCFIITGKYAETDFLIMAFIAN